MTVSTAARRSARRDGTVIRAASHPRDRTAVPAARSDPAGAGRRIRVRPVEHRPGRAARRPDVRSRRRRDRRRPSRPKQGLDRRWRPRAWLDQRADVRSMPSARPRLSRRQVAGALIDWAVFKARVHTAGYRQPNLMRAVADVAWRIVRPRPAPRARAAHPDRADSRSPAQAPAASGTGAPRPASGDEPLCRQLRQPANTKTLGAQPAAELRHELHTCRRTDPAT